MITTDPSTSLEPYPPDLVARVGQQADEDADFVIALLRELGLAPPSGETRGFPAGSLLELGAAGRLFAWERRGLDLHRGAGLPSARDALLRVFNLDEPPSRDPSVADCIPVVAAAVFVLTVERLAWTGPRDLRAEILLDIPEGDDHIDATARFLWDNRRLWSDDEQELMS
jgi:hypothetical protein